MSNAHTPGPWVTNTAGSAKAGQPFKITEIYVYAPDTQDDTAVCADVIDPVTQEPSEANARLISAAPDLLEAAKLCLSIAESWIDQEYGGERFRLAHEVLDPARAAIAKATCGYAIPTLPIPAQPVEQPLSDTIEVFYQEGDAPFICRVSGKFTTYALMEIEKDVCENPDFSKGDGTYRYEATRFPGQYGFEGRCEIAPCWELNEIWFESVDQAVESKQA